VTGDDDDQAAGFLGLQFRDLHGSQNLLSGGRADATLPL
jgi:hypothetical protein